MAYQYDQYKWLGKKFIRPDARDKATGALQFISDMDPGPDCLYGKIFFADKAHAWIRGLDYSEALKQPGVVDVVTAADVPGLNGFGIMSTEQPVFCEDKVHYYGDPVCCVIAESDDQAREALKYIRIEYEDLPVNVDITKALDPEMPVIAGESNKVKGIHFKRGEVEKYLNDKEYYVVRHTYDTPIQEHAYLECEFAIAEPTENGGVEIWCPTQYGFQDRRQLCEVLDLKPEQIVEHTSPLGGAFGGKDDMTLQPIIAVCVMKLKKRIRIDITREESMKYSGKRVPCHVVMETSCDKNGKLMTNKVDISCDMGPYNGVNSNVYDFAVEHSCGNYIFEAFEVNGYCLRTNRLHSGAFRGFGNPQITYCIETQIEELAHMAGMDPAEFREKNFMGPNDRTNFGTTHTSNQGLFDAMDAARKGDLWTNREAWKAEADKPWIKRGVGIATSCQGENMGSGVVDAPFGNIRLEEDGCFTFATSIVEMGQGSIAANTYMVAEALGVDPSIIRPLPSDTSREPDSGGAFASRGTFVSGRTLGNASKDFLHYAKGFIRKKMGQDVQMQDGNLTLADGTVLDWKEVYRILPPEYRMASGHYVSEETPYQVDFIVHYMYAHSVEVVGVEINELTGKVDVLRRELYPSCGTIINRLGYEGQCEGGMAQGLGYAIMEEYQVREDGTPATRSFQTYLCPTICDCPDPEITIIHEPEELGPYGAKGLGEIPMVTGAAVIGNAIADALDGKHLYQFPATPERVLDLIEKM